MLYVKLKELSAVNFKRYCGIGREIFDKMREIVRRNSAAQRLVAGRVPKLETEDQVLLTLEYWREYRTMFHLRRLSASASQPFPHYCSYRRCFEMVTRIRFARQANG